MAFYPDFVDFSTFPPTQRIELGGQVYYGGAADLDPSWTKITGARAVLEHIARRLITTPGSYDDPEYGFDINTYLNENLLAGETTALAAAVREEASQVEGVESVDVRVILDPKEGLFINISVTLADENDYFFVFVLGADTIPRIYFSV